MISFGFTVTEEEEEEEEEVEATGLASTEEAKRLMRRDETEITEVALAAAAAAVAAVCLLAFLSSAFLNSRRLNWGSKDSSTDRTLEGWLVAYSSP